MTRGPWCPCLQGTPRALVFHLFSEKVGLWPPTACCHPQLVYVWPGMRLCQPVPPPGSHCLHASLPTTFLAPFSCCFFSNCFLISPLKSLLLYFLLQPLATLGVCNVDTLEGETSVYDHCLQSVHYSINQYISPREELAWTWECVEPWGREGHKFHITDSPIAWGDLSYLGDA